MVNIKMKENYLWGDTLIVWSGQSRAPANTSGKPLSIAEAAPCWNCACFPAKIDGLLKAICMGKDLDL